MVDADYRDYHNEGGGNLFFCNLVICDLFCDVDKRK